MNYSGYFTDKESNKYYVEPRYNYLKIKGTAPKDKSFNDIMSDGENTVYSIISDYGITKKAGFPTGAYGYGILITLNPNAITSSSNWWSVAQIYIADMPASYGVYFRTRLTTTWIRVSGTAVNPVTE